MQILKKLLFSEGYKYSQLKEGMELENNQFTFHLKELQRQGLISHEGEIYKLTDHGKEYANRMDTDRSQIQIQAKVCAISVALRKVKDEYEFLVYTRLKQPFFGSQGFPSGKVKWGELIQDACRREFKEETSLEGEPELYKVRHYIVHKLPFREIVEDKIFFFFRFNNPQGELIANEEGKFEWVKEKDLESYLVKPFDSVQEVIDHAIEAKNFKGEVNFQERHEYTNNF